MNNKTNSMDKPSLHWSQNYMKKVWKIVNKNSKYNFSKKSSPYNNVPTLYEIEWLDFLPFFIGWAHSLFNASYVYGLIRSSSIFNTELYKYFRKKIFISIAIHFIFGPVLIFFLLFFSPLMDVTWETFSSTWSNFSNISFQDFVTNYVSNIIKPYFNGNGWWISLLIFAFGSCLNFSTLFTYSLLIDKNDDYMRLIFLQSDLEMKLTSFKKR